MQTMWQLSQWQQWVFLCSFMPLGCPFIYLDLLINRESNRVIVYSIKVFLALCKNFVSLKKDNTNVSVFLVCLLVYAPCLPGCIQFSPKSLEVINFFKCCQLFFKCDLNASIFVCVCPQIVVSSRWSEEGSPSVVTVRHSVQSDSHSSVHRWTGRHQRLSTRHHV